VYDNEADHGPQVALFVELSTEVTTVAINSKSLTTIILYEGVSKTFRTDLIKKYTLNFGITRCCPL
jgi:hypothetical protein